MSDARTNVEFEDDDYEDDDDYRGPGRTIAIAAVIAVALGVGGYFAGHASANGPSTLAEAVQQAQQGKLACGDIGTASATPATSTAGGPPTGAQGGAFLARAICGRGQNGAGAAGAGQFGPGAGGGRFGFGGETGTVKSISPSSITIQTPRNGTVTLKLSSSTQVSKTTSGSLGDIKPGDTVAVAGTGQSNSTPATRISILPTAQ
jgi:hypothetical protein